MTKVRLSLIARRIDSRRPRTWPWGPFYWFYIMIGYEAGDYLLDSTKRTGGLCNKGFPSVISKTFLGQNRQNKFIRIQLVDWLRRFRIERPFSASGWTIIFFQGTINNCFKLISDCIKYTFAKK